MKLGTKVHLDVLRVHAEKKIPCSTLTLTFGPLTGAPRLKMADFRGFWYSKDRVPAEKKFWWWFSIDLG